MNSVLHIINSLEAGGAETMLVRIATGLKSRGIDQYVASLKPDGIHGGTLEKAGVPVTKFGSGKTVIQLGLGLVRLARRLQPSIIQGWMYHGNIAATLTHCLAGGRSGRRLMWNIRASNMDAERYSRIIGWTARLSRFPDTIIANSHAGMAFHKNRGFHPNRDLVIPNGIETDIYRPDAGQRQAMRRELGFSDKDIVVINVARVDPMKDHSTLLEALRGLPEVKGLLVGLGTEALDLPENVRAAGLRRDVARLYPAADMLVSSSAFGEGFSNAIGEGMSSGLVPIVTDVGDSALIVENTGPVVPPRDTQALARAISSIASLDRNERRALGLKARERIVQNFDLEQILDRYEALYGQPG